MRLDSELDARVEAARGDVPFERFARRALENECLRLHRAAVMREMPEFVGVGETPHGALTVHPLGETA